jgi:hypothetical protein
MTRLLSLDRVTPASHFAGMWDALSRNSITDFLQGQSRPRRLTQYAARRRNHNRWRRHLGIRCLQFSDLRRVKRVPASQICQRSTFFSCMHIIARSASLRKNPSLLRAGRQLRGADPPVVIRPETTHRTLQTVSGVPLEGGQAHRGPGRLRTTFVLTTLTREGIAHPRVVKEPLVSTIF